MNLVKVYSNNIYKQLEGISRKIFVNAFFIKNVDSKLFSESFYHVYRQD